MRPAQEGVRYRIPPVPSLHRGYYHRLVSCHIGKGVEIYDMRVA
ncbi:MAG TPA: hypothetical protein VFB12_26565 [Ktedonobacteraceae bacterium]|nr:hypothetical protein [Ktedonobacteraceae bacterium]